MSKKIKKGWAVIDSRDKFLEWDGRVIFLTKYDAEMLGNVHGEIIPIEIHYSLPKKK